MVEDRNSFHQGSRGAIKARESEAITEAPSLLMFVRGQSPSGQMRRPETFLGDRVWICIQNTIVACEMVSRLRQKPLSFIRPYNTALHAYISVRQ